MKELLLASTLLAMLPTSIPGAVSSGQTMNSPAELMSALKAAKPSAIIRLAPGEYSGLRFDDLALKNVVITSADPTRPAVLRPFAINRSTGLTFRNLEFSNAGVTDVHWSWRVQNSKDIAFDKLDIHGSLDGNPQNDRQGIQIRYSSGIQITNSEFHELYRAISPSETSNILIADNQFHDNARTGIFSSNVQHVQISNNRFTDSYPVEGDHMDAIAFTRIGPTNTTKDVLVSGNVITRGKGRATQGIFFRDSTKGKSFFQDIQIRDNLIIGMGYNGIYINNAENVVVENNTVVAYPGKSNNSWILLLYVRGGRVAGNRAPMISTKMPNNVNVVEKSNKITSPVKDEGRAALAEYAKRTQTR